MDAYVQQGYKSLSLLFLKFRILDFFVKAAEVSVVGKVGIRKYTGHTEQTLALLKARLYIYFVCSWWQQYTLI